MKTGENMHGFTITGSREMKDCSGTLWQMRHEKSGAQLCWLQRQDPNMTFSVAFKTTPENDTGVFHILEHSVLNGSRKYPVREPFVELLKSSMQTFLNAMTYPDKTMYPISSRNRKDFMNLMSVYMDAVFHPAIYENPNIFYQEGWHYEIRRAEDAPVYKGVVFNEMKGAFSSVDETIVTELDRMMFPDNCYQYVSGGDPVHIPDLSYEKFIETHQKYYHPSNARFFLDGNLDIEAVLSFLDQEYLSGYDREEMDFSIPMQEPTASALRVYDYEIAPQEDPQGKTIAALGKVVSRFDDVSQNIAWQALSQVLASSNESPFKKAILEQGLGEDVELQLYDGIQQPWAAILVRNTTNENAEKALQVLKDTAADLVEHGLDHEELLAALNQLQFQYLEKKEPAGIMFAEAAMNAWLYDGDPAMYLNCGEVYEDLRRRTDEGYFEQLLSSFLLDDGHLAAVIARPNPELGAKRLEEETERLAEARKHWTDVNDYISLNAKLDEWQAEPDTPEQIGTLPQLALADVEQDPVRYEASREEIGGADVLIYPKEDSGIVYLNLYFNLGGITREHLSDISLMSNLFTELPTRDHTVQQLQSEIRRSLGSLKFTVVIQRSPDDIHSCMPALLASCSVLQKNIDIAKDLIEEILKRTVFTADTVRPLLRQNLEDYRQALISAGHSLAVTREDARLTADGAAREYTNGIAYGMYLRKLNEDEAGLQAFLQEAELAQEILMARSRLTISFTDPANRKTMEELIRRFEMTDARRCLVRIPLLKEGNEGFVIPAQISYAAASVNIHAADQDFDGSWRVLGHILTYQYLWSEVRVKGGAYGTGFNVNPNGTMTCWSYRDPSAAGSFEAFRGCGEAVRTIAESGLDFSSMIIGAVAGTEPLLAPADRIRLSDFRYFTGMDYDRQRGQRIEMLTTTAEDLVHDAEILEQLSASECVIGSEEIIKACGSEALTMRQPL